MKIGIRSPLIGLIASAPSATPVFSRSVDRRSISVRTARLRDVRLDLGLPVRGRQLRDERVLGGEDHERRPEQGVRPGREHAQLGAARRGARTARSSKSISPPSLRPIQLVCWVLIGSGQSQAAEVEQLVGVLGDLAGTTGPGRASRPARRSASNGGRRPRPARGRASRRWGTSRPATSGDRRGPPSGTGGRTTGSSGSSRDRR